MRSNLGSGCISLRATSICIGAITTVLWLPYAYAMAANVYRIKFRDNDASSYSSSVYSAVLQASDVAAMIGSFASLAASSLMVFGAVKRIPDYMFPWLAIHFVLLITGIAMSFSFLLIDIHINDAQTILLKLIVLILIIGFLRYFWGIVYVHYKRLNTRMQVEPTCLNEGKVLKIPEDPENPYVPV